MSILSDVAVMVLSYRSKMSGYAAKESVLCCWMHNSANVASWGGRRGLICVLSRQCMCADGILSRRRSRVGLLCDKKLSCSHFLPPDFFFLHCCQGMYGWLSL